MRTLLLSVFFGLHLAAQGGVPAEPKLIVRFYTVVSGMCCGDPPGPQEPWPFSLDELPQASGPGRVDGRDFLRSKGVEFPPGSNAVYLRGSSLLVVKNTAENLSLVGRIIENESYNFSIRQVAIETRLVEFRPEAEGRLAMRGTFADLQKALGDGVRTVAVTSLVTKSGNRAVAESGRSFPDYGRKASTARPPAESAMLDVAPTLGADGTTTDLRYALNFTASHAAGRAAPKVQLQGTRTIPNGVIEVADTFTLSSSAKAGEPKSYAVLLRCEPVKSDIKQTVVEARLVEFRAAAKARLAMRGTFADLQQALGENVRTVMVTHMVARDGNRSVVDSGQTVLVEEAKRAGARRQSEGSLLEVEPQIGPDGWTMDINFGLNYAASAPARQGAPRVQLAGNLSIASGEIVVANTFSLADPGKAEPRRFAVLMRAEIVDEGRKDVVRPEPVRLEVPQ